MSDKFKITLPGGITWERPPEGAPLMLAKAAAKARLAALIGYIVMAWGKIEEKVIETPGRLSTSWTRTGVDSWRLDFDPADVYAESFERTGPQRLDRWCQALTSVEGLHPNLAKETRQVHGKLHRLQTVRNDLAHGVASVLLVRVRDEPLVFCSGVRKKNPSGYGKQSGDHLRVYTLSELDDYLVELNQIIRTMTSLLHIAHNPFRPQRGGNPSDENTG
jgi:hypothetical protein